MPQIYEVRGIKFFTDTNDMEMSHRCTFAISLRLPSGSYWVSNYLFLDDTGYTQHVHPSGKRNVVARGLGVAPSLLSSDAIWPKEVIEPQDREVPRSKAKLNYIRKKGDKKVLVKIDVWAKRFQTVTFNMLEEKAALEDETIEINGKVSLPEQGDDYRHQHLQRGPWFPDGPAYSPT